MKNFKIYLAGQMSGISFEDSDAWRKDVKHYFNAYKHHYDKLLTIINPNDYYSFKEKRHETEKEIIRFDLNMVRTSDLILVNLNGNSIGTAMELMLAHELHKPIIGYKDDDKELHPWLEHVCDRVFKNLYDTIGYVEDYYLHE